jgi:predicted GIY-YIG superfamily endonuclease
MKQPAVYMMASARNGTLYVGVTSILPQRAWHHRTGAVAGFTKRYGCKILVWYEVHATMPGAIAREADQRRIKEEAARFDRSHESNMARFVRRPHLVVIASAAKQSRTEPPSWIASSLRSSQ